MTKVVINTCFGGFNLSELARVVIATRKSVPVESITPWDIRRDDADLVAAVEGLGDKAGGDYTSLKVVEIPDDIVWFVKEYDGMEHIAEAHRTWS